MSLPAFTDDDRAFLQAILSHPAELTAWLAYADWLDEHEDPRAEFIRLEVRRTDPDLTQTERYGILGQLEDLRAGLDPDWVAIFDRPRIENCDDLFAFKCPKQWEQLTGTDNPNVRHCDACRKHVYYCITLRDAYDHAQQGHCVAVSQAVSRHPDDLRQDPDLPMDNLVGRMRVPAPEPEPPRRPWWKFW